MRSVLNLIQQQLRALIIIAGSAFMFMGLPAGIAQEHSYAPADIETGRGLYQANCLGCHGDNGDAVDGANLSTGRFRRASSDEDLIRLIRTGIPNTPMPPHNTMSVGQVRTIVAFLRALPAGGGMASVDDREILIGNPERGEALFNGNALCSVCHGINGGGLLLSPDLAGIGSQRSPASLELSILEPGAEVRAGNRFYEVSDLNGKISVGKLLNQDTHSVQMMNEDEKLVSFLKSELSSYGFMGSPMPSYLDVLSPEEVSDVVAYLLTLTEENAQ
ncbi:c-type cytochrome [Gammaproteobacteria bacterium]|nr:c-type cytochrome [Gammaproteobacteria bacterium]